MSFDVGADSEDISGGNPRLNDVGIFPLNFVEVGQGVVSDDELTFTWEVTDDTEHQGQRFNYVEFSPREQDFQAEEGQASNAKLQVSKIGHVVSKLTTLDEDEVSDLIRLKGTTIEDAWQNLVDNVLKAIEEYAIDDLHERVFRMKLIGNVYQGNANAQTPRYTPFLRDVEAGDPALTFSNYEENRNAEFRNFMSDSPDDPEQDEFSFDDAEFDEDDDMEEDFANAEF